MNARLETQSAAGRCSEIEDAIARGEMDAAQVFTQMRQLIDERARPARVANGCYLVSFKHQQLGDYVSWWGPNNRGYTSDLEQAGIYASDQIKPGYHDDEDTVPVPVALVERLRVRRMVDPGDTLNASLHSAKTLREWIAAQPPAPPKFRTLREVAGDPRTSVTVQSVETLGRNAQGGDA